MRILQKIFEIQELTARHRYVDALAELKKIGEQEPAISEINILRGSIYLILHDPVRAKIEWEKALASDPSLDDIRARIKTLNLPADRAAK